MMKMTYRLFPVLAFLLCWTVFPPAIASDEGGEGYAPITYEECSKTMAFMRGVDVNNPEVADEYARIAHCDLYQKNYQNDIAWRKIRTQIIDRVLGKKDHFRTLYEITAVFKLGRYDFDGQFFPLSKETAMVNVGSIVLLSSNDFRAACGGGKNVQFFPWNMNLVLNKPLTVNRFKIPAVEAEKLLTAMTKMKIPDRMLYGRIRFRVTDAPGLVAFNEKVVRADLRGEITGVDFFLDSDMTIPAGSTQMFR